MLAQDDGPLFHCILDEGALRRPVGGRAVMRAQLARIIEAASLPKVTFQLIPLDVGAHPALDSTFVILEFDKPMVNDVVYVEGVEYQRSLARMRTEPRASEMVRLAEVSYELMLNDPEDGRRFQEEYPDKDSWVRSHFEMLDRLIQEGSPESTT